MSTHTIKGFITWRTSPYAKEPEISFLTYDPSQFDKGDPYPRVVVSGHAIEVEVPDNFNPNPQMVAMLMAQKEKLRADFAAAIVEYDRRINELLAIENTVEAA